MAKIATLNQRLWAGMIFGLAFLIVSTFVENEFDLGSFDVSPISSFMTVLTSVFFTAIVSKSIYDHINRESQKRQWKVDYALRQVREIYGPLWNETKTALSALEAFREPRDLASEYRSIDASRDSPTGFRLMVDTHLGFFIDAQLKSSLALFHDSLDKFRAAYSQAWSDISTVVEEESQRVMTKFGSQGSSNELNRAFQDYLPVIYDSHGDVRYSRDAYFRAHEFISHSRDAASEDYGETLTRLRELEAVDEVRVAMKTAVANGEEALRRLKEIINDPFSVVLEFNID